MVRQAPPEYRERELSFLSLGSEHTRISVLVLDNIINDYDRRHPRQSASAILLVVSAMSTH